MKVSKLLRKLTPEELTVIENNNGLKLYLIGLTKGKKFTPRSNLFNLKGKTRILDPDAIKSAWLELLASLKDGSPEEQLVYQFDLHQLEKWGPQGGVEPISKLLDEIVLPTFSSNVDSFPAFSESEWEEAKRIVVKLLHQCGAYALAPVSYERVVDDMRARDTLESNSGWPDFTTRHEPEVVKASIEDARNGQWKTYPAIALFRNYNNKTRLVWMFPMSVNLVEGSYFQPLQSVLMRSEQAGRFLAPWSGFDAVKKLITEQYAAGKFISASDFSSTDAHFKLATSLEVFDVIKYCFQPRFRDGLEESIRYMHEIPLIVGPNECLVGEHGVSSGSNWTNFIETIFDWILAVYVSLKEQNKSRGLYAIGDDMSWCHDTYQEDFSIKLQAYGEGVGQEIKADKTTNDRDKVKSLQRLFIRNYLVPSTNEVRAVYPTLRALKSLVFPERFHKPKLWSKDMEAIRALMILENCVDHPLFNQFCEFVAQGDPHIKEFCLYRRGKQERLFRLSKLVPGLNPTYNQEKRNEGISAYDSVKFIASLGKRSA